MLNYWLWLVTRGELSARSVQQVLRHFGTPREAFCAARADLARVPDLTPRERAALEDRDMTGVDRILDLCASEGIHILTCSDAAYPDRLRQLEDAPAVLYWKGSLPALDFVPTVAVVGTRSATEYGLRSAHRIGAGLAAGGCVVVSGMAKGIDAAAVDGCLRAGGTAVGVLGCGVDVIYPRENTALFAAVEERGCLISEYPPGTRPLPEHFPVRNRIISGLCAGVTVVEAPLRSGTMITARLALEQGRDVFALPGPADAPNYAGNHLLLRQGAILTTSAEDILEEYRWLFPERLRRSEEAPSAPDAEETEQKKEIDSEDDRPYIDLETLSRDLSPDELAALEALLSGPLQADELSERAALPVGRMMAAMTMLQVRGIAEQNAGKFYQLRVRVLQE